MHARARSVCFSAPLAGILALFFSKFLFFVQSLARRPFRGDGGRVLLFVSAGLTREKASAGSIRRVFMLVGTEDAQAAHACI